MINNMKVMGNKHQPYDLKQMQSIPLDGKIIMTKERIRQWYEHWDGMVYVSFSGGKDSTVLKHIVDSIYNDVPAVFVNTGLEYPEIQKFVRDVKAGKWDCFNTDVEIIRPQMRFDEVIKKYGYPVITKRVADTLRYAKRNIRQGKETYRVKALRGELVRSNGGQSFFNCSKWSFLVDAPFDVASDCCSVMKKKPIKKFAKQTQRVPITAQIADESVQRRTQWIQHGCNAFDKKEPISNPLSFWTEQDVLRYIKEYNVPYCPVYGEIVYTDADGFEYGQTLTGDGVLTTTRCDRTGCIFCMFGCHLEKEPNRFQRLKQTHPKQYEYCINGGEMVNGKWQPNEKGLGLGKVLDYIGVKYD